MASVTSLDKDLAALRLGKFTPEAAAEVKRWIESVLNERIPGSDLMEALRDGVILCKLVNKLTPNAARYKESEMPFKQMENISMFLKLCSMPPLSLPEHDLFLTVDLYEMKDPAQVLQTIQSFSRKAHAYNPSAFPQAIGPRLGTSPAKGPKPPVPARSPAVSTWAKPEDEGVTQPAWNIATYGYMGGSNQEKMGVSFGGRRQITFASPHVPSLREKEERRRQGEQQSEELRRAEEQTIRRREEAEEQRRVKEEEETWRQKEVEDRRRIEQEERLQRRFRTEEDRRDAARLKEEQWEKEQAEKQKERQSKLDRERAEESRRIRELELELEMARERERRFLEDAHKREQEAQAAPKSRPVPAPKPKPAIGSKPLPYATQAAQRQRQLQDEDEAEEESSKQPFKPSTPPPTPLRNTGASSPAKSPPAFGSRTGSMLGRGGKVGETLIEREIRLERERQRDWERNQELLREERAKMTPQELADSRNGLTDKHDSKAYFGGANQGSMGVSFGAKRQIIGNPPR